MIIGAHTILNSKNPDADRAFLCDVLGLSHVDQGGGWLIFGLPPSEVAVHPADENGGHERYLMCDDVQAFIAQMKQHDVACAPVYTARWGLLTHVMLPGGSKLGVYEPRHPRPQPMTVETSKKAPARTDEEARRRRTERLRRSARAGGEEAFAPPPGQDSADPLILSLPD